MEKQQLKEQLTDLKARLLIEIETIDKPHTKPYSMSQKSGGQQVNNSPIISDELRYINLNWNNWDQKTQYSSHRKIIGPVICFIKRKLQGLLFDVLLKDYIEREKSYQLELIRLCNKFSHYIDQRDGEIFWNTVSKMDNEFSNFERRYDSIIDSLKADK
jgi:hypothetical protein